MEVNGPGMQELLFFQAHEQALPPYLALREQLLSIVPGAKINVKQTQISFCAGRTFAVVSFLRPGRGIALHSGCITVSFGLPCRSDSTRVCAAVQIREGRWTHHAVVCSQDDIDEELLSLLRDAASFSCGA